MKKLVLILLFVLTQVSWGQWEQCNNGLWGASVRCLLKTESSYFLGTSIGGIYQSSDKGENWIQKDTILRYNTIYHLAQLGDNIFASTDSGVYRSSDNGLSWELKNPGNDSNYNYKYSFATLDNVIFASSYSGVYSTTNLGLNWEKKLSLKVTKGLIVPYAYKDGIYISTNEGLYSSKDMGENWSYGKIDTGRIWITSAASLNDKLIIGSLSGIYISLDNGAKWILKKMEHNDVFINTLATKDGNIFAGTTAGVYVSSDNGDSWIKQSEGLIGKNITSFLIDGESIYTGIQDKIGGVYKLSDNGNNWIQKNMGLTNTFIGGFEANGDKIIAKLSSSDLFYSSNSGSNWASKSKGLVLEQILAMHINSNNIFVGTLSGGIYHSTNDGEKWMQKDIGMTNYHITSIVQNENNILVSTRYSYNTSKVGDIFFSSDYGISWELANSERNNIQSNKVDFYNNNFYFIEWNTLYESKDSCKSWNYIYSDNYLEGISALEFNKSNIFIGYKFGVFMLSTDFGNTWERKYINNIKKTINTIKVIGNSIFASFDDGNYFYSLDNGDSWTQITFGTLKNVSPYFELNNNYLIVGTFGNGIFRKKLTEFGVNAVNENTSDNNSFTIQPNPANDQITVSLNSTEASEILIYNSLGEEVMSESIHPMTASHRMNIVNLPKGMYYVKCGNMTAKFVKL